MSRYRYSGRHRHGHGGLVHVAALLAGPQHLRPNRRRPWWLGGWSQPARSAVITPLPVHTGGVPVSQAA